MSARFPFRAVGLAAPLAGIRVPRNLCAPGPQCRLRGRYVTSALLALSIAGTVVVPTNAAARAGAPKLATLAAPAGSSVTLAGLSAGKLPTLVLSKTPKRGRASVTLRARRRGKLVGATLPLNTPSGVYRVLACSGSKCVPAKARLLVQTRLTGLLAPLTTTSVLQGTPQIAAIKADIGGTVSATDSAGNSFALDLPARALPDDTTVSITPLASLKGLPKGASALAGVRIEPEGLQLNTAAKLTVHLARPSKKGVLVTGFVVPDGGRGLALAPVRRQGDYTETPVSSNGSTFTVTSLSTNFVSPPPGDAGISIAVDPGKPSETDHYHAESQVDGTIDSDLPLTQWLFYWGSVFHQPQASTSGANGSLAPWTFTNFTPGSGATVGTKAFDSDVNLTENAGTASEHSLLTLTHTPDPTPPLPKAPPTPPKRVAK